MRVACYLMILPLVCYLQAAAGDGKDDLKALQGEWIVVYSENGSAGKFLRIAPEFVSVKGNTWVLTRGDLVERGTFAIDPNKKPKTIDITYPATSKNAEVTREGR